MYPAFVKGENNKKDLKHLLKTLTKSMDKSLPDKWIRKAVYDAVNNTWYTFTIPCYDGRVVGNIIPDHFILLTTQTNQTNQITRSERSWESSI